MQIVPEYAPRLSILDECKLLRSALDRRPLSHSIRFRLASLLNEADQFDEVIRLLSDEASAPNDYATAMLCANACLARGVGDDNARAVQLTQEAINASAGDVELSAALSLHAKTLGRVEQDEAMKVNLRRSLELDPSNVGAFKRLALHYLRSGAPEETLRLAETMLENGKSHSRVLAAKSMALASLGQVEKSQSLGGISRFLSQQMLQPPAGWASLESFNHDLVAELLSDQSIRFGRFGTASEHSWRIDHPLKPNAPAVCALLDAIAGVATRYAESLDGDHPWISARPDVAKLRSWCVITGAEGYEQWHMHPHGWMSGGYYPQVPDELDAANSNAGCLALGLPEGIIGQAKASAFGETLVRPSAGLLTLFPSHSYHRTYPHATKGQRICIAFDICPA
jgi:tetratricopeptide (TPR) repeat protein